MRVARGGDEPLQVVAAVLAVGAQRLGLRQGRLVDQRTLEQIGRLQEEFVEQLRDAVLLGIVAQLGEQLGAAGYISERNDRGNETPP